MCSTLYSGLVLRPVGSASARHARVAVVFDQDVRVASCLVCQRQFSIEENARDTGTVADREKARVLNVAVYTYIIYIYIYTYIYIYVYTHIDIHIDISLSIYIYIYT